MSIINVGIDAANVERFTRLLDQNRERLFSMMFGKEERTAISLLNNKREADYLAGRWAAKEATLKALGTGIGPVTLPDVGVFARPSGQPYITLYNEALKRSHELNIDQWHLSITHVKEFAIAYVIAERTHQ